MIWLDNAICERTNGMPRLNDFNRSPLLSYSVKETGEFIPYTRDANEEWELRVTVGVKFWANRAQKEDALKNAQKVLLQRIHGGLLGEIVEMRKAIFDGDGRAALAICSKMQEEIGL